MLPQSLLLSCSFDSGVLQQGANENRRDSGPRGPELDMPDFDLSSLSKIKEHYEGNFNKMSQNMISWPHSQSNEGKVSPLHFGVFCSDVPIWSLSLTFMCLGLGKKKVKSLLRDSVESSNMLKKKDVG